MKTSPKTGFDSGSSSTTKGYRKVYHRNSQMGIAGYMVLLSIYAFVTQVPLILKIFLCIVAAFLAYSAFQIRLVITEKYINYYQVSYSIQTTWDNLAKIGEIPAGRIMAEGLILNKPALAVSRWLAGVKYIQTRDRFIPLSLFKKNWRDSTLGADIKKFAPHLFHTA